MDGVVVDKAESIRGASSAWSIPRRVVHVAIAVALMCGVVAAIVAEAVRMTNAANAPLAVDGITLGLTPSDVRERFSLPGSWRSLPTDGDYALAWTGSDPTEPTREARFEFHLGSLVAVRARVSADEPLARGGPLVARGNVLLARSPRPDGDVDLLLVARDCPTHAAEVAALLQRR